MAVGYNYVHRYVVPWPQLYTENSRAYTVDIDKYLQYLE